MTDWLNVGKIVNTHGIRGEVRVISRTDFPETRYAPGSKLYIYDGAKEHKPVIVKTWRKHKQFDLLSFEGFDNVNEVEKYKDKLLKVKIDDLDDDMYEGEYYYHEIIGLSVYTDTGTYIGKVKEILSPGANDVWVVKSSEAKKEILLPYIDDVIKSVDLDEEKVVIHPMEGLLDE
ncbi:ribosome maturation factor RimM [Bacillus shivajii]|uniref:ribosome maturation factor RimM n=1 Tax=Bacillus shivajii TaxID=1983719 RepID=UPI001CFB9D81|nr:ribosome maturation factor RimM [Bacillus shivajii]UCZ51746.1 ribosome maturation factor RimM [Bacillus shivajii]